MILKAVNDRQFYVCNSKDNPYLPIPSIDNDNIYLCYGRIYDIYKIFILVIKDEHPYNVNNIYMLCNDNIMNKIKEKNNERLGNNVVKMKGINGSIGR